MVQYLQLEIALNKRENLLDVFFYCHQTYNFDSINYKSKVLNQYLGG